jgi:hypothetical protein
MPTVQERQAFLRSLAAFGNPAFTTNPQLGLTPDALALGASKSPGQLVGALYLASLLTQSRAELTDTLATLPKRYASDVRFFAPALVDYSYWLDDFENVSSLDDQIGVMSDVAARKGRPFAVHPYVSFCPWRQMVEPKQFDSVKDAIQSRGFLGVKLYPVMGFLPTGNAHADPAGYPDKLRKTRPDWVSHWRNSTSGVRTKAFRSSHTAPTAKRLQPRLAFVAARRAGRMSLRMADFPGSGSTSGTWADCGILPSRRTTTGPGPWSR